MIRTLTTIIRKLTPKKRSRGPAGVRQSTSTSNPTPNTIQATPPASPGQKSTKKTKGSQKRPASASSSRPAKPKKKKAPKWDLADFKVPSVQGKTRFHDLGLPLEVMHAVADLGFEYCTPIQAEIMPSTLKGRDAGGRAQTGTGKTAAFLITVIARMLKDAAQHTNHSRTPRVLILAPTRELVLQIAAEAHDLAKYTNLKIVTVFGGMDYDKQRRQLSRNNTDIVVATPGRLLDFNRRSDIILKQVETLIIDEADRMLDMGFIPDVRKIINNTPHKTKRQTLLFSATLTPEVTRLSSQWTKDPVMVEIEPEQVAVDSVEQIVYIVTNDEKYALLYNIITRQELKRVIVFCNRKDETRRLSDLFLRHNINCAVLSGDVPQHKRIRTLNDFKAGKIRMLVATDVAGRGIHIEGMDHVINYTLPRDPEDYVHRIGRTGRAGAEGTSISFADEDDSFSIPAIEDLIGQKLPCTHPDEAWLSPPPPPKRKPRPSQQKPPKSAKRRRPARRPRRSPGTQNNRSYRSGSRAKPVKRNP